jgi:hypothetical protein
VEPVALPELAATIATVSDRVGARTAETGQVQEERCDTDDVGAPW